MKRFRKFAAIILAVVLAVQSLPATSAKKTGTDTLASESTLRSTALGTTDTPETIPTTRMRFVQKITRNSSNEVIDNGFDPSTGILTMSLQVKPEIKPGDDWWIYSGNFLFQTDMASVVPITLAGDELLGMDGAPAIAGVQNHKQLKAFGDQTEATWFTGEEFMDVMGGDSNMHSDYTALVVARGENSMLNCFFQFVYKAQPSELHVDDEGYLTLLDFRFQCYDGDLKPLATTDALYANSIRVPQTDTESEKLRKSFVYRNPDNNKEVNLTMSGAAFIQNDYQDVKIDGKWRYILSETLYYYFRIPNEGSRWYCQQRSVDQDVDRYYERNSWWTTEEPTIVHEKDPCVGLWYTGCSRMYRVDGFVAELTNTYGKTDSGADFIVTSGDNLEEPRYVIPTMTAQTADSWNTGTNWIPAGKQSPTASPVPLKYYVRAALANGSSIPEGADWLDDLQSKITWEFWLDGTKRLSEVTTENESAGEEIDVSGTKYTVKTAEIKDDSVAATYQGKKVWKAYDSGGTYLHTAPVGVIMVMTPSTVTYEDPGQSFADITSNTISAPQLYVSSDAAKADNYIWHYTTSSVIPYARFEMRGTYEKGTLDYNGSIISLRLYKDPTIPDYTTFDLTELGSVSVSGETKDGFYVGTAAKNSSATETRNDAVSNEQVSFKATLFDQYGTPFTDKWNKAEIIPTTETQNAMKANGKTVTPFTISQEDDTYTIIYKDGKSVNDVTPGTYLLKTVYEEKGYETVRGQVTINVVKPEDRFDYMETRFRISGVSASGASALASDPINLGGGGKEIDVTCRVPIRVKGSAITTVTAFIELTELANQWRNAADPNYAAYDIIPDCRDSSGVIFDPDELDAAENDCITYEVVGETPYGISANDLRSGKFTFNNKTDITKTFTVKVTAKIGGVTKYVLYKFTFTHADYYLSNIVVHPMSFPETKPNDNPDVITIHVPVASVLNSTNTADKNKKEFDISASIVPYNQYDKDVSWPAVMSWASVTEKWKINYDPAKLPDGVKVSGEYNQIWSLEAYGDGRNQVTPDGSSIEVTGSCMNVTSENLQIVFVRDESVPSSLGTNGVTYDLGNSLTVPAKNATAITATPSVVVFDQYGARMSSDDYTLRWTSKVEPASAAGMVSVEASTGKITVKPGATNCTVTVSATVNGTALTTANRTVTVKRADDIIVSMEPTPTEIVYPSYNDSAAKREVQLTAYGRTQYSEDENDKQLLDSTASGLGWVLTKVEFCDNGGTYVYNQPGQPEQTGDGEISYVSDVFTVPGKSSIRMTNKGLITWLSGVSRKDHVPKKLYITLTNNQGGKESFVVNVVFNEESTPYAVYFPTTTPEYRDGVQIPNAGTTKTINLTAEVQDQYGFKIEGCTIAWEVVGELPPGMSDDTAHAKLNLVSLGAEAPSQLEKTVTVKATATKTTGEGADAVTKTVTGTADITIINTQKPLVKELEIYGIKGNAADDFTIILPAGKSGETSKTYTLNCRALTQFGSVKAGVGIEWSIDTVNTTTGVEAAIDPSIGVLTLNYTDDALTSCLAHTGSTDTEPKVVVTATTKDNGSGAYPNNVDGTSKTVSKALRIVLAPSVPTYAVPKMEYDPATEKYDELAKTGYIQEVTVGSVKQYRPVVPQKGAAATQVRFSAKVKDQYGEDMSGYGATMSIIEGTGLTFTTETVAGVSGTENTAKLYIESTVVGYTVSVTAVPTDPTGKVIEASRLPVSLSKGVAVADELYLAEDNNYTIYIPTWRGSTPTVATASVIPPETTINVTDQIVSQVVDQYGSWMESVKGSVHPVWELVGEPEGVKLSESMKDSNGKYSGENLILEVSNTAVPPGETQTTITVKLSTAGVSSSSEDYEKKFEKTINITLVRRISPEDDAPKSLYIADVNANGVANQVLKRPGVNEDGSTGHSSYDCRPLLYDTYGALITDPEILKEIKMDLDAATLIAEGFHVEAVYGKGHSQEEGYGPSSYNIYRIENDDDFSTSHLSPASEVTTADTVETLIADFDCDEGIFTINTDCVVLESFKINVTYAPLGSLGNKSVTVKIEQDDPKPTKVTIAGNTGSFFVDPSVIKLDEEGNVEDDGSGDVNNRLSVVVYDQYGQRYSKGLRVTEWKLFETEPDQYGNRVAYTELDEDGTAKLTGNYLIQLSGTSGTNNTLVAHAANYDTDRSAIVWCKISDTINGGELEGLTTVTIKKKATHSSSAEKIKIRFEAGELGKLVGPAEYEVSYGSAMTVRPGVKTLTGYGFLGWTSDGQTLVDVTKIAVFSSITYTAVYKDITNTKFLEGYTNGTVRPDAHVTRAEFVAMVVRAVGGFDSTIVARRASFPDVPEDMWYAKAVIFAVDNGIISGYPDGTFRPDATITRGEAARILADLMKLKSQEKGSFLDVPLGSWYEPYIEALREAEVVAGYPDGTYKPENKITRAEAVRMILMLTVNAPSELERYNIRDYAYCPFSDIKREHWAYAYILRAAGVA